MEGFAAIVTHHKTGTVWMQQTFRQIAAKLRVRFIHVHKGDVVPPDELVAPIIFFERGGKLREYRHLRGDPRLKIIHLIRDPRDVVISSMHYHCTSQEDWLHRPSERLGGRTYQAEINALRTSRARYVFEMDNRAATTIRTMLRWLDGGWSNSIECKYEDLIGDVEMILFTEAVTHLGFFGQELEICRKAFWKHSLFGRRADGKALKGHIRSGAARQWANIFDKPLAEEFARRFDGALTRLGYETDNSWIEALPDLRPELDVLQ